MEISKHSRERLLASSEAYIVLYDHFSVIYNYLIFGYPPGSFWHSVLANDFFKAMSHSHPANSVLDLKNTTTWILNALPTESYGDYNKVRNWCNSSAEYRRLRLENRHLIYTEEEETMLLLSSSPEELNNNSITYRF